MSELEQYRTVLNPNSANAMMIYLGPNTGSEPIQEAKDELIIALDDKQQSQALYIKRLENNWKELLEWLEEERTAINEYMGVDEIIEKVKEFENGDEE